MGEQIYQRQFDALKLMLTTAVTSAAGGYDVVTALQRGETLADHVYPLPQSDLRETATLARELAHKNGAYDAPDHETLVTALMTAVMACSNT